MSCPSQNAATSRTPSMSRSYVPSRPSVWEPSLQRFGAKCMLICLTFGYLAALPI